MAASSVSANWLEWVCGLQGVGTSSDARKNEAAFACRVEDQPGMLVPPRLLQRMEESGSAFASGLKWNSHCHVCGPGEVPPPLAGAEEWRRGFAQEDWTIWVHDANRGQWQPFSANEDLAARCAIHLKQPEKNFAAEHFSDTELSVLVAAGILLDPAKQIIESKRWRISASRARERFEKRGYTSADGLLHPFHVGEMRRYYRRLIRQGSLSLGDYQSARRYVAHNEPVARFFHLQLTPAVAQLAGERVKPSYVYFASYLEGAELKKHTDREQCEISLTFCLDYAPEPDAATPWPIQLETARGRVSVGQMLGEALLYRGCEIPHFRDQLPEGHTSTSIFFHYVPESFSGPLS